MTHGRDMVSLLERAITLAVVQHSGQVDKAGAPYIRHPLRVMERLAPHGETAMVCGVLHDVVEDGTVTLDELRQGFGDEVATAVALVTKRPEEARDYEAFIGRIIASKNVLALRVKYADLLDNGDVTRLGPLTAKDIARLEKYSRAALRVLGALD